MPPVYVDQDGNYYFNATALSVSDSLLPAARADLVSALTAVSPNKRQVSFRGDAAPILFAAVDIPDSQAAAAQLVSQRLAITALNPSGIFTVSDTWIVPAGVNFITPVGIGGGGGGGGGNPTPGGGGGGGGSGLGLSYYYRSLRVIPGETLTITIGSRGLGGAVNTIGGNGGATLLRGSLSGFIARFQGGLGGNPGLASDGGAGGNGGTGTGSPGASGGVGAVGGNPSSSVLNGTSASGILTSTEGGAGGGALNFAGGLSMTTGILANFAVAGVGITLGATAPAGGASGGGGGMGGCQFLFGANGIDDGVSNCYFGGLGGANGLPGSAPPDPTSYGSGGGGGSGNAAGGNGNPGALILRY